jgi:hypothetical protein
VTTVTEYVEGNLLSNKKRLVEAERFQVIERQNLLLHGIQFVFIQHLAYLTKEMLLLQMCDTASLVIIRW